MNGLRDLINLISSRKHLIPADKLEEEIIKHLNKYANREKDDLLLGNNFREDITELNQLITEAKPIRQKVFKID